MVVTVPAYFHGPGDEYFLMAGQSLKQYEVGVVGHLLVRTNFKEDLIDCRWLHFVDNSKRCPR